MTEFIFMAVGVATFCAGMSMAWGGKADLERSLKNLTVCRDVLVLIGDGRYSEAATKLDEIA